MADDTAVPLPGYHIRLADWNGLDDDGDPHVLPIADGLFWMPYDEAIAACHRHRNRIAAEALRDAAARVKTDGPECCCNSCVASWLTERADTLDPKETL